MKIQIHLKKILEEYKLDKHGVIKEIAEHLGVHRHTITNLYYNNSANPSLDILGRLAEWMINNGVPQEILPQGLFASRPSQLWEAVAALKRVTIYLGEYQQTDPSGILTQRWVSLRDAEVLAEIVKELSRWSGSNKEPLMINTKYVPFRLGATPPQKHKEQMEEDIARARDMFKKIRKTSLRNVEIFIGSQRVNFLLELLVADLFGCEAFVTDRKESRVPFYLVDRSRDRCVPSCFGGQQKLPGSKLKGENPGIYYRDINDQWTSIPWRDNEQDGGIVLTAYDPGTGGLEMAIFGFTGRGTAALGAKLREDPDVFWPEIKPERTLPKKQSGKQEKQVTVYICRFTLVKDSGSVVGEEEREYTSCEIITLAPEILKKYLR